MHQWTYQKGQEAQSSVNDLGEVYLSQKETVEDLVTWIYQERTFVPSAKIQGEEQFSIISDYLGRPVQSYDQQGRLVWQTDYDIYGKLRNFNSPIGLTQDFIPFRQLGQYEDVEIGLYYNRFRYYDPEAGVFISQDPISIAGGLNIYAYVKDTNTWVDIFGLSGELVYQLLNAKGEVVYYGITSRTADARFAEHLADPNKIGKISKMQVLAENLTHDQARSIEGALIRKRLRENIDNFSATDSIEKQLEKSGLLNKNRGRVKERWTSDNPLEDLKDKMNKKPRKVSCG